MEIVARLLDMAGIGRDRLHLRWVSASEGQLFAKYVTEYTEAIEQLGPFDPVKFELSLRALESTLKTPRVRWLLGIGRSLTHNENVYKEKLKEEDYDNLLKKVLEEEYHKALVLEVIQGRPSSVREISGKIGLPVYTVSLRLNELERSGQAELKEYDGTTPLFIGLAA